MYGDRTTRHLGSFETSGKLIVTDPCYERVSETDMLQSVVPVKPGKWFARIQTSDEGNWGSRVAELTANHHENVLSPYWEWYGSCGVDSGQLGFFDYDKYPIGVNGYTAEYDDVNNWYKKACNETYQENNKEKKAGIVEGMGVNSSSGFGDGQYEVFVGRNDDGEIVAIKAVFIPEDGDDYD